MSGSSDGGRARTVRIGFVQTEPTFGVVEANLDRAERLVLDAPDFDVLVLPELFASGYLFADADEARRFAEDESGPTVTRLRAWAKRRGAWICGGLVERGGDRVYNASALVGPGGEVEIYRKIHLFDREPDVFSPGDRPFAATEITGKDGTFRVGQMICFDWAPPEAARCLVLAGAEVLLHPSNLMLGWCQDAMRIRCLENQVFAVTANRTGEESRAGRHARFTGASQITGPQADVVARAGASGQRAMVVEVDLLPVRTKRLTGRDTALSVRRPETYGPLVG